MMFGSIAQNLILLMERCLKNDIFEVINGNTVREMKNIKLYKIFEFENKVTLRITPQLEKEYCCFYHFLMGKRRVMEKANKINVS